MDRRQNKTRKAVFHAMERLLPQKDFARITVQEIIDEADIGRSTFYSHFETKEDLMRCLCAYIFHKIRFPSGVETEGEPPLEERLVQVLQQGKKYRRILQGMYAGEAGETCERYIREELRELFRAYLPVLDDGVPEWFVLRYLTGSFAETLRWWVREDCPEEPEEIAGYYLRLTRI